MAQKRDSPSIWGIEGWVSLEESTGETFDSVAVDGGAVLDLLDDSTTSSDSRLTGSPMVVSFASLDMVGLCSLCALPDEWEVGVEADWAPRS